MFQDIVLLEITFYKRKPGCYGCSKTEFLCLSLQQTSPDFVNKGLFLIFSMVVSPLGRRKFASQINACIGACKKDSYGWLLHHICTSRHWDRNEIGLPVRWVNNCVQGCYRGAMGGFDRDVVHLQYWEVSSGWVGCLEIWKEQ